MELISEKTLQTEGFARPHSVRHNNSTTIRSNGKLRRNKIGS